MDLTSHKKINVVTVFGTRPEAIKCAPVIKKLEASKEIFRSSILVTAQHRDMLDQAMKLFSLKANIDLDIMMPNQSPIAALSVALSKIAKAYAKLKPDLVLVQGDTTTTLAGSVAAFYSGIPVGHIEAGLRTYDLKHPFPEEGNRKMVSTIADWHFAATKQAKLNLLDEHILPNKIVVTGNPVVDALEMMQHKPLAEAESKDINFLRGKRYVIITAHRRENFGKPMLDIAKAVLELARQHQHIYFVFPVHRNPAVQNVVNKTMMGRSDNLMLMKPIAYHQFIHLLKGAQLILTDSGGIQEEASAFGVQTLIMRKVTERPEALHAGAKLILPEYKRLVRAVNFALKKPAKSQTIVCPFGDGRAADRIVRFLAWAFKKQAKRPRAFSGKS